MNKLRIEPEAAKWYKQEMGLEQGEYLQFVIKLYGQSIHPNYSLAIEKNEPHHMSIFAVHEGITYYFEKEDAWFLEDHQLIVRLSEGGDVEFVYESI